MVVILLSKTESRLNKMELKELLDIRRKLKGKKPNFIRQDAHKKLGIKRKWRRSKGIQSKMRLKKKGYRRSPSQGYRSSVKIRSLHRSGLKPVLVASLNNIKIKKESEGAVIGNSVGLKKRYEIVKKLEEMQIKILNIKDVKVYLKKIEDMLNVRKEEKKKLKEKKEKKKQEKSKKGEKLSDKLTEEEKKKEEKKKKDKLLTKKT